MGAAYVSDNNATDDNDTDTIVVGVDYTTGPFKIGASYLNEDREDDQNSTVTPAALTTNTALE